MSTDPNIKITIASAYDPTGTNQAQAALRQTQATAAGIGNETITNMADQMKQVSQATNEAAESTKELSKNVQQTGDDYEALQKRVNGLEEQIKNASEAHVTHRKKAEQSAGGIVGAYTATKKAVMGVKNVIKKLGWWINIAIEAWDLISKLADYYSDKSRKAKEQTEAQTAAEEDRWKKLQQVKQAVHDIATAQKIADQEAEKSKINSMYENRLTLLQQTMEKEALQAEFSAKRAGNDYAVKQAQLQRDLALGKIDQAEYEEKMRAAEIAHNETLRQQEEAKAESAVKNAQEQMRINQEKYDIEFAKLRKLKEIQGSVFTDDNIFEPGKPYEMAPLKPKVLTPDEYNTLIGNGDNAGLINTTYQALNDNNASIVELEKKLKTASKRDKDLLQQLLDLARQDQENNSRLLDQYLKTLHGHKKALVTGGYAKWDDTEKSWADATNRFSKDYKGLAGEGETEGSVLKAQKNLNTSTEKLTQAQNRLTSTIATNNNTRQSETEITESQNQIREDRVTRDAIVKRAQDQVDHLQGKQNIQRQNAAATQTGIDLLLQGSTDDKFRTLLDRYAAAIAQRPEGKQRTEMQEAFEKFKGYISAAPEQLAGKQEEITKILQQITLSFSELGSTDLHTYDTLVGMLQDKITESNQIADTAKQQQSATNDLSNLKQSTAVIPEGTPAEKQQRATLQTLATEVVGSKQGKTSEQEQQALDTIAGLLADGKLLADERAMFSDAIAKLAETDQATANYIRERLNKAEQTAAEAKQEMDQPAQGDSDTAVIQRNLIADQDGSARAAQYRSELETIIDTTDAGSRASSAAADALSDLADNVMDPAELERTAANAERLLQSTSEADRATGACLKRIVDAYGTIIQQQQARTAEMNGLYQTVDSLTAKFLNASIRK